MLNFYDAAERALANPICDRCLIALYVMIAIFVVVWAGMIA